ncbi:hypothetical protein [Methanocella conradii]|nr:hypothetical protein [Methanocella conradii]MDI6896881.1 hypothetical protein [Methanocella conradii]
MKAINGDGRIRKGRRQGQEPYGVERSKARVDASIASINAWYRR